MPTAVSGLLAMYQSSWNEVITDCKYFNNIHHSVVFLLMNKKSHDMCL